MEVDIVEEEEEEDHRQVQVVEEYNWEELVSLVYVLLVFLLVWELWEVVMMLHRCWRNHHSNTDQSQDSPGHGHQDSSSWTSDLDTEPGSWVSLEDTWGPRETCAQSSN